MGRNKNLTAPEAMRIKEMLWQGTAQQDVAVHFGVSQATISRIQRGDQWPHVRWPDGSTGALPTDREKQIVAQRFPGVAVRGIIHQALSDGLTMEEIARRVQGEVEDVEEEKEQEHLGTVLLASPEERKQMLSTSKVPIQLISRKQWIALKKLFPTVWWKDVDDKDRIKQTAVYTCLTAEGADEIPGSELRRQIDELERRLIAQNQKSAAKAS